MPVISDAQIAAVMRQAGFPASAIATGVAVALAESGGNTTSWNKNTDDRGLFQINVIHAGTYPNDWAKWQDPLANARMALGVFKERNNSWAPWVAYQNKSYTSFLARGQAAARMNTPYVASNPSQNDPDTWSPYNIAGVTLSDPYWKTVLSADGKVPELWKKPTMEAYSIGPWPVGSKLGGTQIYFDLDESSTPYRAYRLRTNGDKASATSSIEWDQKSGVIKKYTNGPRASNIVEALTPEEGSFLDNPLGNLFNFALDFTGIKKLAWLGGGILIIALSIILLLKNKKLS